MSVIVTLSGGKASAWCADMALKTFPKKEVILYFNDTKWEHPDLYRFLHDLESHFNHEITIDSDGRSPEQLFKDENCLASNRWAFCSRILKAKRLQSFYKDGDVLIFGIGLTETHRADRICSVYQKVYAKTKKRMTIRFPIIETKTTTIDIDSWLCETGIEEPLMYKLGFKHNNCSGGCVRSGKKQWALLLEKIPEVYRERERVEEEMRQRTGKDIHYLKDETLRQLRERIQSQFNLEFEKEEHTQAMECIGICDTHQ